MALWMALAAPAFQQKPPPAPPEPPESDESLVEKQYQFNPLQASREMKVGEFYWKKGSWSSAAMRFQEATRWNPQLAEAFLRLGETHEKMARSMPPADRGRQMAAARQAYAKFLELAPEDRRAAAIRKKVPKSD